MKFVYKICLQRKQVAIRMKKLKNVNASKSLVSITYTKQQLYLYHNLCYGVSQILADRHRLWLVFPALGSSALDAPNANICIQKSAHKHMPINYKQRC